MATTGVTCPGSTDGSITLKSAPNFEYGIDFGNTGWQTSPTFSNLPPGTYTLYVRDMDDPLSAEVTTTATVAEPLAISVGLQIISRPASLGSFGILGVTLSNGWPPYILDAGYYGRTDWDVSFRLPISNGPSYIVKYRDSRGCQGYFMTREIDPQSPLAFLVCLFLLTILV